MRKAQNANAVLEYALPLAVLAGLFFTLAWSGVLNLNFQSNFSETEKAKVVANKLEVESHGKLVFKEVPGDLHEEYMWGNGLTYSKGDKFCLYGQYCSQIPDLPASRVVEVDGGLGGRTAHKLSALLDQMASQLKSAGVDDSFVKRVRALANAGHALGDRNLEMEAYMHGISCERDSCNHLTGQSAGTPGGRLNETLNTMYGFVNLKNQLNEYVKQHPEIKKEIPEAINLINQAGDNIYNSASGSQMYFTSNGAPQKSNVEGRNDLNGVIIMNEGSFIHMNANTICDAGKAGA
ncbi:MAG: hypothetical protein K2X66_16895, partial [Cyanobacteria bacterium]|nr:hypothetical protein [Cyanobacteriota bacterium]